ncbi:hypothetical protein, partial [Priestia megaterium]|uniref:hypothetical protein n=1 Tax=Priestia megaterium TaxID=1404 RepID=UPI003008B1F4
LPSITCEGDFEFFGAKCIIPPFELSIDGKALSNLANSLWDYMKDILIKLLKNADYWLKMLRDGIIKGVEQVAENIGKLLSEVHQISAADIASKTQEILKYGPEKISEALKGAGTNPNEIVSVLQNIHISTDEIQSTLKKVFAGTHVDTISQHIDTPEGPHVDIPEGHQDISESHQDIPEKRIDENIHVDIPRQHTDTRRFGVHTDFTVIPHVDENTHTDTVITPRVSVTTPHVDTKIPPPHVDTKIPPHGDTNTHVDTNES